MNVDINEVSNYLLGELLKLQAKVTVLEGSVSALMNSYKPDNHASFLKAQKDLEVRVLQQLLIDHPYLQDGFDEIVREATSGDQPL